jgi:hypothetical protein
LVMPDRSVSVPEFKVFAIYTKARLRIEQEVCSDQMTLL